MSADAGEMEYVGDTSFEPGKVNMAYRGTIEEWLHVARDQFVVMGFALAILNQSDEAAETGMRACGETDEESLEATIQLLEAFIHHSKHLEFDKCLMDRASARMQVIAERLTGRDVMEEAYRH